MILGSQYSASDTIQRSKTEQALWFDLFYKRLILCKYKGIHFYGALCYNHTYMLLQTITTKHRNEV